MIAIGPSVISILIVRVSDTPVEIAIQKGTLEFKGVGSKVTGSVS